MFVRSQKKKKVEEKLEQLELELSNAKNSMDKALREIDEFIERKANGGTTSINND